MTTRPSAKRRAIKVPTTLAAEAAVDATASAAHLTRNEKKRAIAILAGEVKPTSQIFETKPLFKACIIEALNSLGITPSYLGEHIKSGLEATNPGKFGRVVDWHARHKYLGTTLEMLGVSATTAPAPAVYKSNLRGQGEIIDVTPPKSDVAKRRMATVRPTNRKDP